MVLATARMLGPEAEPWYDGRLWMFSSYPGIFHLRVAKRNVDLVLRGLQGLVIASRRRGLEVAPLLGSRLHRSGVGIGARGNLASIEVVELRHLAPAGQREVSQWRAVNHWRIDEGQELEMNPEIPRGNDKLRVLLPPRPDWPHRSGPGWRRSFTAPVGDPFLALLGEVLAALDARAKARP
jgi:hypothetical protein